MNVVRTVFHIDHPSFFALRYEDLTLKPYDTVDKMFKFLSLRPKPEFIDKFIATHTGVTRLENDIDKHIEKREYYTDPYGTTRQSSKDTAFKWLHTGIDNDWLNHIENVCSKPMEILGYANYSSETKKAEDILVKTAEEVWPY